MSTWALAHFFAFITNLSIAVFILSKNARAVLNRSCAAVILLFSTWSLGTTFMRDTGISLSSAELANNLASLGWISFSSAFLYFVLLFTSSGKRKRGTRLKTAILAAPLPLLILQWTGGFMRNYRLETYGWVGVWDASAATFLYYAYFGFFIIIGLFMIGRFRKTSRDSVKRKQATVLLWTVTLSLLLGSISSLILRGLGIYSVPPLGDFFTIIFSYGLFYSTARYRLFELNPAAAADNILETMIDALMLVDTSGKILSCNPAMTTMLGYERDDLLYGEYTAVFPEHLFKTSYIKELLRKGSLINREGALKDSAGRIIPALISASVMRDLDGKVQGFVMVAHDYSEIRKAQDELIFARDAAEGANRAKSAFLANMSHEIRTPLNAILGFAQLMLAGETDPGKKEKLSIINQSGETLLNTINDILDFSRIEAGKITLNPVDFSLRELCEGIVRMLSLRARQKELMLNTRELPGIPALVGGDVHRIRQVLSNLVDNALKFTENGSVTLEYGYERESALFRVIDTGIGIPEEKHDAVFSAFDQVDPSSTRRHGGTGLGLAIVKSLVLQMGGTISLKSAPGEGSVFIVGIPLPVCHGPVRPDNQHNAPVVDDSANSPQSPLRVLVAEDNELNRRLMGRLLETMKMDFDTAENGKEALEKLHQARDVRNPFNLLLMDIQMPVMDGVECLTEIRNDPALSDLRVIALTAHALPEDAGKYMSTGFDDYISKPIDIHAFFAKIKSLSGT